MSEKHSKDPSEQAPESTLGSFRFSLRAFENLEAVFATFYEESFQKLGDRKRSEVVNKALLSLIQKEPEPAFLFPQVLHFIEKVDQENLLHHYIFTSFELWLNQYSNLSDEENYRVRAKIMGKYIPRDEYQSFFPIGMGKVFSGTHFVTAHKSPDLDTTIASFWGWVDAFAARVGSSLHIWNLPGGPPPSQIEMDLLFRDMLGPAIFSHVPKTRTILSLTGNDLMTQKDMLRKKTSEKIRHLYSERTRQAVVIVDEEGYYLGDFRSIDADGVRQVLMLMNQCLRSFENRLHIELIGLFSNRSLRLSCIGEFIDRMFSKVLEDSEQVQEFSAKEKERLSLLIAKVFGAPQGLQASFAQLGAAFEKMGLVDFSSLKKSILSLEKTGLFDFSGQLIEDRPLIFSTLAHVIADLHQSIQRLRLHMEDLSLVLRVKNEVFELPPQSVSVRSDVEEIRGKMRSSYQYLTVTYPDRERFFPVGIIPAASLRSSILGTVSLRDFSNRSEMTIPSYLEVISVLDHHPSTLRTNHPARVNIQDAQSSNTILGQLTLAINDQYSTSALQASEIEKQMEENPPPKVAQRLWRYRDILSSSSPYYVHPEREMMEYIHFLYGILDDTDLLSKVSNMDVEVVAALLNRLKTLLSRKETCMIDLGSIPKDAHYATKAAKAILQNRDMYSLYKKVYAYREEEVERNILLCAEKKPSNIFSDTKDVNGLARVGQTKIFAKNVPALEKHKRGIQQEWYKTCLQFFSDHRDFDLYLQMISTIVSAEEVYQGTEERYQHQDELWIWPAPTDLAVEHLKRFLSAFQEAPQLKQEGVSVLFLGDNGAELDIIFQESFMKTPREKCLDPNPAKNVPLAVIRYQAATINSRKSMISPYLPILSK
ncbi:MAG: hypothetical protein AAGI90_03030 [Chlamydiota bacterium]